MRAPPTSKLRSFSRSLEEYKKTTSSFPFVRYGIHESVGTTEWHPHQALSEYASLARVGQKGLVILPFANLGNTDSIEFGVLRRENLNPMDCPCES